MLLTLRGHLTQGGDTEEEQTEGELPLITTLTQKVAGSPRSAVSP